MNKKYHIHISIDWELKNLLEESIWSHELHMMYLRNEFNAIVNLYTHIKNSSYLVTEYWMIFNDSNKEMEFIFRYGKYINN